MQPPMVSDNKGEIVFETVPTYEEMQALSDQASQARAGRARLQIALVFLAGVIFAGGAGFLLMQQNASQAIETAQAEVSALNKRIAEKDQQLADQSATITTLREQINSFGGFQSIVALQQQAAQVEADIATLLAQPSRQNIPGRMKELPPAVEWLDPTVTALEGRLAKLKQIKADIEAWPPPPTPVRPD